MRSSLNHYAGLAAEDIAERRYVRDGYQSRASRWRGPRGEIDLICSKEAQLVFIEVKHSKTHAKALQRISTAKVARVMQTAQDYLAHHDLPTNTEMRFDAALVDGYGQLEVLENIAAA